MPDVNGHRKAVKGQGNGGEIEGKAVKGQGKAGRATARSNVVEWLQHHKERQLF